MSEELIDELALSLDMFLTHHVERDTLACDLTNEELTLMATGIADIIRRRELEAGEKVREAAANILSDRVRSRTTEAAVCCSNLSKKKMNVRVDEAGLAVADIRALDVAAIIGDSHD